MKSLFYRVILSMVCSFALAIASCSDDDNAALLSAPGDIKYSDISSTSFKVTWATNPDATSYVVRIKDEWGELSGMAQTVTETSATFTGLDAEKKYWVAICSTTGNATSPFSKWIAVRMAEGSIAQTFASGEGLAQFPFVIETAGQLKLMAYLVNKTNELKNDEAPSSASQSNIDIEMDPEIDYSKAYYVLGSDIDMSEVSDWTPIGTGAGNGNIAMPDKNMFGGNFDGKGYTIRNLVINSTSNDPTAMCGLFGLSDKGCKISNLNVEANITAVHTGITGEDANYLVAGGILAYGYAATISNCTFKGGIHTSFTTDIYGTSIVGGISGILLGNINGCTVHIPSGSQLVAMAESPQVGGIVGYGNSGSLTYCKVAIDGEILAETKPINESEESGDNVSAFAAGICGSSNGVTIGGCEVSINGSVWATSKKTSDVADIQTSAYAGGIAANYAADMLGNCTISINGSVKAEASNNARAGGAIAMQQKGGYGATSLHATISGEIKAIAYAEQSSADGAYAGGIYGSGSYQTASGGLTDSDVILNGKITAEHPAIAMTGGIAGSIVNPKRCWAVINKNGVLTAKGGIGGASCGGVIGNLVSGAIYACYSVCKGTIKAESETGGRNAVNVGGIAGACSGTRVARKSIYASYSLIEGSMIANGETTLTGAIAGMTSSFTTLSSIYWWSASDAIKGHTGAGASDAFKLPDTSRNSLEEAAMDMNGVLEGNAFGYYFYREKDGYLNITTSF